MKIKIRRNAVEIYIEAHTDWSGEYFGDDYWERLIKKIAGKTLEVDTSILFKYEYNIKPTRIIKEEIRISEEYVEKIIDDERHGKAYCELCNSVSNSTVICTHCGKSTYLDVFFDNEYDEFD